MKVEVRFEDQRLMRYLIQIPHAIPKGIARGLNRGGKPTATKFLREAKRVLGIGRPRGALDWQDPAKKSSVQKQASAANLRYLLVGFGKPLSLKYFRAQETRAGVSATPMNVRKVFPSTFIKGGRFPNRKDLGKGGTVFKRTTRKRKPIEKQFGPAFPEAFSQPSPVRVWEGEGGPRVMNDIVKELDAILKGYAK